MTYACQCPCGTTKFEIHGEPITRFYCHCTICQQQYQAPYVDVTLYKLDEVELQGYDKIVIGASIRYGKHRPSVLQFINDHQPLLEQKPNAFFSVNVVARKPQKNRPHTNPYFKKFLRQINWVPRQQAVFAGKINYSIYSFWDRNIIRFIMWLTRGPTDPNTNIEFTNWSEVDDFGRVISEM